MSSSFSEREESVAGPSGVNKRTFWCRSFYAQRGDDYDVDSDDSVDDPDYISLSASVDSVVDDNGTTKPPGDLPADSTYDGRMGMRMSLRITPFSMLG